MTSTQPRAVELHGRQSCHYQLANPGNQALGRISEFLAPLLLDPQSYGVMPEARLVSSNLVGVGRNRRIGLIGSLKAHLAPLTMEVL